MITILNWRVNYLNWQLRLKKKQVWLSALSICLVVLGSTIVPNKNQNDIAVIGKGVHRVFDEVLIPAGLGDVKIFTELGRFMLAPHGLLVTKVRHRKQTYRTYIGVDASAVNLMRPAMYDAYHHITNVSNPNGKLEVVDVVGSLCENNDKFAKQRELPEARVGDTLVIHDTGAHGFSMGYQYNGLYARLKSFMKKTVVLA